MAGEKMNGLNTSPVDASAWADFIAQFEQAKVGDSGVSLTNWALANRDRPEITAGSYIEISGGLYQFTAQTPIVDGAGLVAGTIYLRFEPLDLDANPTFTNEAPTWANDKNGYYDSTGEHRYSGHQMEWNGATSYTYKGRFDISKKGGVNIVVHPSGTLRATNLALTPRPFTIVTVSTVPHVVPPGIIHPIKFSTNASIACTFEWFDGSSWVVLDRGFTTQGGQSNVVCYMGQYISDGVNYRLSGDAGFLERFNNITYGYIPFD